MAKDGDTKPNKPEASLITRFLRDEQQPAMFIYEPEPGTADLPEDAHPIVITADNLIRPASRSLILRFLLWPLLLLIAVDLPNHPGELDFSSRLPMLIEGFLLSFFWFSLMALIARGQTPTSRVKRACLSLTGIALLAIVL